MTTPHSKLAKLTTGTALALLALTAACGSPDQNNGNDAGNGGTTNDGGTNGNTDGGMNQAPTVLSHSPLNAATNVALNTNITARFSDSMDVSTINTSSFKVTADATNTPVQGTVLYSEKTATFIPGADLLSNSTYTATVTTQAKSAAGVALAQAETWSFTTGNMVVPGVPVNLGTAGGFVILAKTGISTVPSSAITGDIGVSPAAASYITGFSLTADSTNVFATSPQVTGKVYAADYASPTPSNLTTAVSDMETAFTDAAGRASDFTELAAGDIGGMTLTAGVYKWGTGVLIPSNVTLKGKATDVFIFQIAQDLTVANATQLTLSGGVLAKNVFWQVAGKVELGTTSHFEGVILSQTSITLGTGASINGRMLAQTAVSIDQSTVVQPAQ